MPRTLIIDYAIADGGSIVELEKCVKALQENGFEPFGSLTIGTKDEWFYQPMVEYHVEKDVS